MTTTQRFQNQELIRIGDDDNYLLPAPRHGGRLVRWVRRGQDILYWPDDADWTNVARVRGGNPLLFPFIARHVVDGQIGKRRRPRRGRARYAAAWFCPRSAIRHFRHFQATVSLTLRSSPATQAAYPFGLYSPQRIGRYRTASK
jgi:aldose 1-epimerase